MTRKEKCELALVKGYSYNSETGDVYGVKGGKIIRIHKGYLCIGLWFQGKTINLYCHQFAWFVLYGECVEMIDHKNRIKTDNRSLNLRKCSRQLNSLNRESKGYTFNSKSGKWLSQIMIHGKTKHLGRYKTKEIAKEVYENFKSELIQKITQNGIKR